jgi:uncharacterized protein (TIGR02145 family)
MKKAISLHFMLLFFSAASIAQSVGIGTTTPNRSAKLEVQSSNSGFLPPRMTLTERDAIPNPAQGLMLYCTDCVPGGELSVYNGTNWISMFVEQSGRNAASLPRASIGQQVWSTKNLDVVTYRNGDTIPQVKDSAEWRNLTTGAWCWYNNDSASYAAKYGRLYNWYAVNDPRGLAPQGWHVPSSTEWNLLTKFLDPNADTTRSPQSDTVGGMLKNTSGWTNPNCSTCINGSNSSGFSGMPGGYRSSNSRFLGEGNFGIWWTSNNSIIESRFINASTSELSTILSPWIYWGFYVRVVRDQPASGPYLATVGQTTMLSVGNDAASCESRILSDGGSIITAKGVCWSTTRNPTITSSDKTMDGPGMNQYNSNITGLTPCTNYFIRSFATNALGTSYGNEQKFTTTGPVDYSQITALQGDYSNTYDYLSNVSRNGPYTTKVISMQSLTSTTAEIMIDNIWDTSWAPIKFMLDWTDPNNRTVTLENQTNIGLGSTLVGTSSPYSNWQIQVGPGNSNGTFSLCGETISLNLSLGVLDPATGQGGFFGNEFTVEMSR